MKRKRVTTITWWTPWALFVSPALEAEELCYLVGEIPPHYPVPALELRVEFLRWGRIQITTAIKGPGYFAAYVVAHWWNRNNRKGHWQGMRRYI